MRSISSIVFFRFLIIFLAQIIVFNNIEKMNNNAYLYDLDMSYASPGVYFVKIGNTSLGYKTGRIIVK